ncbi:hypothetical protein ACFE04_022641 [Oxalis oulophora]
MGNEAKRVQIAAIPILILLIVTLIYAVLFTSWKQEFSNWKGISRSNKVNSNSFGDPVEVSVRRLVRGENRIQLDKTGFACHSDIHSELCVTNKPVRIDSKTSNLKVYIPSFESQLNRTVKPYARQEDATALKYVSSVQILNGDSNLPACQFTHDSPVVIFSSGGFAGNLFHEFNEIIIPLFITSHHFKSHLQFFITDYQPWWVIKYKRYLLKLSNNEIINSAEDKGVHCFQGAVVGLKFHDNLAINSTDIPVGYSMYDFKKFLAKAYNLKNINVPKSGKPVLMLISRQQSRTFLNEEELVVMMKELGFGVVMSTPNKTSNLENFSQIVNSCSVIVGIHGAGLTNEMFLPSGAVLVQVVPLRLQWASTNYYGMPSGKMGIKYLEYQIEPEESSLYEQYGKKHPVITDPTSIEKKGYYPFRAVYVDGQNVKLNLSRFRKTLVKALELLGESTPLN